MTLVIDDAFGTVDHSPPVFSSSMTILNVLIIEKETLLQQPDLLDESALDQGTSKITRNELSKFVILPIVPLSLTPISNCIWPELVVVSRAIYQSVKLKEPRCYYSDLLVFFGLFNQPDSPVLANLTIGVEEYDVVPSRFPYQSVVCL